MIRFSKPIEHTTRVSHDVSYRLSKTITCLWGLWINRVSPVWQAGNREVSLGRIEIFENSTFHSRLLLTRNCPLRSFSLQWATVTAEMHNWSTCCSDHECSALNRTYVSSATEHMYQPHAGEHHRRGMESKALHHGLRSSYGSLHKPEPGQNPSVGGWEDHKDPPPAEDLLVVGGCWGRDLFAWVVQPLASCLFSHKWPLTCAHTGNPN